MTTSAPALSELHLSTLLAVVHATQVILEVVASLTSLYPFAHLPAVQVVSVIAVLYVHSKQLVGQATQEALTPVVSGFKANKDLQVLQSSNTAVAPVPEAALEQVAQLAIASLHNGQVPLGKDPVVAAGVHLYESFKHAVHVFFQSEHVHPLSHY